MFIDPISHFFEAVIPAYEQYVELSKMKDYKKFALMGAAMQAANMLFHYRELVEPLCPAKTLTRNEVSKFYDYDLIGDVCNASKHGTLTQKKGELLIISNKDIEQTIVNTHFFFGKSSEGARTFHGVMQNRILVYPIAGGVRDLLEVATNVINYWADFLVDKGFTDKHIKFRYEGDNVLTYEQVLEIGNTSNPVPATVDGEAKWVMIARYYEPLTKSFNRWGFDFTDAECKLVAIQISEDAPNSKAYGYLKS